MEGTFSCSGEPSLCHVAIIMDGNGRWAQSRGSPREEGHRAGVQAVLRVVDAAIAHDLRYLTLFGFSSENWHRPAKEVESLMGLLEQCLTQQMDALLHRKVRFRMIGMREGLGRGLRSLIKQAEDRSAHHDGLVLTIALNYGGRADIVQAVRHLCRAVEDGRLSSADITENRLGDALHTAGIPDPDMLLRTGGESRLSNFLLWQCSYSEIIIRDVLWPDFDASDFADAVREYTRRERRYGQIRGVMDTTKHAKEKTS